MDRYAKFLSAMRSAVLESPGATEPALRRAVARNAEVPQALREYVDKVAFCAYTVTDDDVAALKAAGYTEDQLFEITVSAALGAGIRRLEAGLAALKGAS
jgi:alkylhydroperoxidase family enzyme